MGKETDIESQPTGDNDPIDCIVLGDEAMEMGVYHVKPIGILGMIDDGEMDWKVLAIEKHECIKFEEEEIDPLEYYEKEIERVIKWLTMYKTPGGGKENEIYCFGAEDVDRVLDEKIEK